MAAFISGAPGAIGDASRAVADRLRRSTVQVKAGRSGAGSGIVWSADGLIVTNAHVARGKRLTIEFDDGRELAARVTGRDDSRDIAALRVDAAGLHAATIADSDLVRPGHLAFAVGNPYGVVGAVTSGIVFAAGSSEDRRSRWIQADVRIAPGNSGGPLADARGHVIGVNSMIYSGLAIAVPSNTVVRFLRGSGARPRLGVIVEPVALRAHGAPALGLLIFEVAPDTDAERGGLMAGDVIVRVADRPLRSPEDLPDALADAVAGGDLALTILRGGVARDVVIGLRSKGESAAA